MIDHDRHFKELLTAFFLEFLALFVPDIRSYSNEASVEFLDKELFNDITSGERHEVDLLAKLKFKGQETFFLVHVENQAQPQADFAKRMFRYFARLSERYDLPVYPIALLTYSAPLTVAPEAYVVRFPDRVVLEFRYLPIQLNLLNWKEYADKRNPVAGALMSKMRIAPDERPRVKLECERMFSSMADTLSDAKLHLLLEFVDTYLKLTDEEEKVFECELSELPPEEKEEVMGLAMSWKERAMQEGLQRGLKEGRQEGRQEGILWVVTNQVQRRFGPLDPETLRQITNLDSENLERLADALLDFDTAGDLTRWLKAF